MANENSRDPTPTPQTIPLAKIHDLPGAYPSQAPDRTYGGLVNSIQSSGVLNPVILRLREDGEYQLVAGYRRRRASELAKKQDIPALVYDMTEKEAAAYFRRRNQPDAEKTIPGKLIPAPVPTDAEKDDKAKAADEGKKPGETPAPAAGPVKDDKAKTDGEGKKPSDAPAAPGKGDKSKTNDEGKKTGDAPAVPASPGKDDKTKTAKEGKKPGDTSTPAATPAKDDKAKAAAPTGPAASGPTGTAIKQVFDDRLNPPDEKALNALPIPKEGDSYFITLHPGYLEKSKFNNFSVDREGEDFKELQKSIELTGVKDPVLARPKEGGGLEILSGQRRHVIASILNYPVPTIIQRIDDDDAKILVADSNLHRPHISSYDLSRALKMKMDGMKRKAGRRKKNDPNAPALNTDETLAKEMGMTVSRLNRIVRLSEATEDVCGRYDAGEMELSIASAISFLKPANQDKVVYLTDMGYKISTAKVERMKKVEKDGKLTEQVMRDILDDKDLAPKQQAPAAPTAPATPTTPTTSAAPATPATSTAPTTPTNPPLPPSPDVQTTGEGPAASDGNPPSSTTNPPGEEKQEDDIFKGPQERPENIKVILTGDRLRRYFPDVDLTPREIEESVYEALDEREKRREKLKEKSEIFGKKGKGGQPR